MSDSLTTALEAEIASHAPTVAARFQMALMVEDLSSSVRFYQVLLGAVPQEQGPHSARFVVADPPLNLTLVQGKAASSPSTLNHLGFRLPDQVKLVALQRRLEEAGIATQRQDGVECCYALQTKFWVTDPDRHLWELYVFHQDLDHSGFDDPQSQQPWRPKAAPVVWKHLLIQPLPERIDAPDDSVDEVHLEGTINLPHDEVAKNRFFAEVRRVLRPGGFAALHGMAGDRPFPGEPAFPGIAAFVKHVPAYDDLITLVLGAGLVNPYLEKFDAICLSAPGVELREIRFLASKPRESTVSGVSLVMYRGPFTAVTDDAGTRFPRGEMVCVSAATRQSLAQGPLADAFVFCKSE